MKVIMHQQGLHILLASSLYLTLASATIVLSQFQAINGFPQPCENAYNSPISGCDASDFPQSCSPQCVYALEQAQATIDNACAGSQAPFDSIIGQFFTGKGAQFMCTADLNGGSSASSSSSGYHTSNSFSTSTTTSTASSGTSTSSHTSSKAKSTISTSSTIRRTTTVSELTSTASVTAKSSVSSSTSPTPLSAGSASQTSKVFVTTAFNNGVATVLTSQAQRTSAASSNPDAFGGGGSPFEVGPNGNDAVRAVARCSMLIAMFALGALLLR